MPSEPTTVETPAILARLSSHLDKLAGQIYDIEEALGEVISGGEASATFSVTKLQSLDFVRQSLEDCALLVHQLGSRSEMSIIEPVCVQTLRAKLKLNATQEIVVPEENLTTEVSPTGKGDVDLF